MANITGTSNKLRTSGRFRSELRDTFRASVYEHHIPTGLAESHKVRRDEPAGSKHLR